MKLEIKDLDDVSSFEQPKQLVEKKEEKKEKKKDPSELRQDLVTGDWVVIATSRGKRPDDFVVEEEMEDKPMSECPFENPENSGQEADTLIYEDVNGEWTLRVFPNLFPAFSKTGRIKEREEGPYFAMDGKGYHELIVPRDHFKHYAIMSSLELAEVIDAYSDRYLQLMNRKNVKYISVFHNHGKKAGASIKHPHSQLVAMPVLSPYLNQELEGAKKYKKANRKCVYCTMVKFEKEDQKRVIYENDEFIVFVPFAARATFEMWILPKKHSPYFERINKDQKVKLAEALGTALKSLHSGLNNPDYNFYLHTAPCDGSHYPYFHWHIEILPRTSIWAGFELQTGIEISAIVPEEGAEFLRKNLEK